MGRKLEPRFASIVAAVLDTLNSTGDEYSESCPSNYERGNVMSVPHLAEADLLRYAPLKHSGMGVSVTTRGRCLRQPVGQGCWQSANGRATSGVCSCTLTQMARSLQPAPVRMLGRMVQTHGCGLSVLLYSQRRSRNIRLWKRCCNHSTVRNCSTRDQIGRAYSDLAEVLVKDKRSNQSRSTSTQKTPVLTVLLSRTCERGYQNLRRGVRSAIHSRMYAFSS